MSGHYCTILIDEFLNFVVCFQSLLATGQRFVAMNDTIIVQNCGHSLNLKSFDLRRSESVFLLQIKKKKNVFQTFEFLTY